MFFSRFFFFLQFFFLAALFAVSCTKNQNEILTELRQKIETGREQEAASEIQSLLAETNNSLSKLLDSRPQKGSLKSSWGGELAAWLDLQSKNLYYYTADGLFSFEKEGRPIDFALSSSGHFLSILFQEKEKCRLYILDTKEHESSDHPGWTSCQNTPLISDDGRYLFVPTKKHVEAVLVGSKPEGLEIANANLEPARPESIARAVFKNPFKKIRPVLKLSQVGLHGWIAWYGRGGAYRLYFYPGSGKTVLTTKAVFSRPRLYRVYDGDTLGLMEMEAVEQEKAPQAPSPYQKAPSGFLFERAEAFAYSGGAGKRRLQALIFAEKIRMGKAFPAPIWGSLQFIRDREEFMALKKQHLYYWNSETQKKQPLPLLAKDFLLFDGGLLYMDLMGRLYLRKTPFSRFELELVKLRRKASRNP